MSRPYYMISSYIEPGIVEVEKCDKYNYIITTADNIIYCLKDGTYVAEVEFLMDYQNFVLEVENEMYYPSIFRITDKIYNLYEMDTIKKFNLDRRPQEIMEGAAKFGYLDIIKNFKDPMQEFDSPKYIVLCAVIGDNVEILDWLKKNGGNFSDVETIMIICTSRSSSDAMEWLFANISEFKFSFFSENTIAHIISMASRDGNIELFEIFVKNGLVCDEKVIYQMVNAASQSGKVNLLRWMQKMGYTISEDALDIAHINAVEGNYDDLIKWIENIGKDDLNEI